MVFYLKIKTVEWSNGAYLRSSNKSSWYVRIIPGSLSEFRIITSLCNCHRGIVSSRRLHTGDWICMVEEKRCACLTFFNYLLVKNSTHLFRYFWNGETCTRKPSRHRRNSYLPRNLICISCILSSCLTLRGIYNGLNSFWNVVPERTRSRLRECVESNILELKMIVLVALNLGFIFQRGRVFRDGMACSKSFTYAIYGYIYQNYGKCFPWSVWFLQTLWRITSVKKI